MRKMQFPTLVQIIDLHRQSILKFGGEGGIMNSEGLKSFNQSMMNALVFGRKNIIEMAAWIMVNLIQNHYFVDGNKRVGLGTTLIFLKANGCQWFIPNRDYFYNLTVEIAKESSIDDEILNYIESELSKYVQC
jgi:death on curing protein